MCLCVMAQKGELSPQQEKFCQAIADGKNLSDAYREAYKTARMSKRSINVEASNLHNNPDISLRIKELQGKLTSKRLWTRENSVNVLGSIAANRQARDSDRISAIRELNVMHGYDEPDQAEQSEAQPMAIEYVRQDEEESKS